LRTIAVEREPETLPTSGQRPANIGWKIAGLSDTGLRRELNEDSLVMVSDALWSLRCADGMGGHEAGEIASRLTVQTIQRHFIEQPPPTAEPVEEWLKNAVAAANEAVLSQQGNRTEERKMGSTLVMALVMDRQAHIVNVGDSRAYIVNNTSIHQISIDHSLVERWYKSANSPRGSPHHKQKNVIYSTVGDKEDMEVGFYHVKLQPGDRLLLCSDGLSGMLTDEEIQVISRNRPDPASACKSLIEAAKMAGGHDNITAIIVEIDPG
jgi:protein phosphatase